jgi:hypothetical protein
VTPEEAARGAVLLDAYQDWYCPRCKKSDRTRPLPANAARMHTCPKLAGLTVPLVPAGTDCTLVIGQWEDYQGRWQTQDTEDGRPVSSVDTIHGDGRRDVRVLAPCATLGAGVIARD